MVWSDDSNSNHFGMRVGLLGGSFNPPHQGHLHVSELAIKKLDLNQIWWIPTAQNPLKDANIYENYAQRLQKCRDLTLSHPKIHVKSINDIKTVNLVKKLQQKHPNYEFFWIMGADSLEKFHLWHNFREILRIIPLAIFSREKDLRKIQKFRVWKFLRRSRFKIFFSKNINISSTELRKLSVDN